MEKEIIECYKAIDMPFNSTVSEIRLRSIILKRKLLNKQQRTKKDYTEKINKIDENVKKIYQYMKENGSFDKKNKIKPSFDLFFNLILLLTLFVLIVCFNIKILTY